ncbi:hypothetical protein [Noviherbaspirillum sp. Root189]|uniref:hypothetical protein n=1 Tax=Noviherbaspirillum sp. Root189 TaxID=1736487 RepID=UPI0007100C4C|nr:hypothetical protein [Noviherbaspirillum sp. Root189]KRB67891.1 hypothetical protein ASE07_09515 [Noviherbaspirillum sp. Root189]
MEYRFSLTPRLIALTLFCGVSLLALLFTLGFQIGQLMGGPKTKATPAAYVAGAKAEAAAVTRTASGVTSEISAAAKPLVEKAAWTPKPAP